jgi:Ca-activated chloride channel family protein
VIGSGVFRRIGLLTCIGLVLSPRAIPQDDVFRVDVRLVRLLASVKDASGRLIGSLNKSDFTVFDNGVAQQISLFEHHTEQPLSIALLIDNSGSTAKELRYELDSVERFLRALLREGNTGDAVALYSFNWQVTLLNSFTRRMTRIENNLRVLRSEGGTSLYDAIYLASRDLELREGRHVIVVVTDGGDTTSAKTYHNALEAAQVADTVMYPVLVMPITNDAGRNIGGENALTTLAASTGGRVFAPSLGAELDNAFSDILRELRTQYLIGFYPRNAPATKDRFHTLRVNVRGTGLRVLTRNGYYGDSDQPNGKTHPPR